MSVKVPRGLLKVGTWLDYNHDGVVKPAQVCSINRDGTVNVAVMARSDAPPPEEERVIVALKDDGSPLYLHEMQDEDDVHHRVEFGVTNLRPVTDPAAQLQPGQCRVAK